MNIEDYRAYCLSLGTDVGCLLTGFIVLLGLF